MTKNTIFSITVLLSSIALAEDAKYVIDDKVPTRHDQTDHSQHDHHKHRAPIGVMGDHVHKKGELMASYKFMYMDMGPNYVGTEKAPLSEILGPPTGTTFPIIPTEMQTQMQMLGLMYAPSDNLTLMANLKYVDKAMQHTFIDGSTFRTHSSGIGDFMFGGLYKLFETDNHRIHFNGMFSAPTGDVDNEGFVPPAGGVVRLPYPMQLGSGTWDLHPGITYVGHWGKLSWGSQAMGIIRLGENTEDYTLGNEFKATAWTGYSLTESLTASFRASYRNWGNIDGADANLNPLVVPTARTDLRGGERIDLYGGLSHYFLKGVLKGNRIAAEAGGSVWQDLDGPQLGMDWMATVGWQKHF